MYLPGNWWLSHVFTRCWCFPLCVTCGKIHPCPHTQRLYTIYCLLSISIIFIAYKTVWISSCEDTHKVQCSFFYFLSSWTKEWAWVGRMVEIRYSRSCFILLSPPWEKCGLFICCHNATYVSLCHLAVASMRPVVDQWQCQMPCLSLPGDQILGSLTVNTK